MSTTVRATCSFDCGDVRTTIDKVMLLQEQTPDGIVYQYRFICPECNRIVLKSCAEEVASVLLASGVKSTVLEGSLEIFQRPREEDAPPITLDDIIDLGLALEDEERFINEMRWGGKFDC